MTFEKCDCIVCCISVCLYLYYFAGLWSYTLWSREKRRLAKQLLLSNPVVVRCVASQVVNHSKVLQRQEQFAKSDSHSKIGSFLCSIVGFGTGLVLGAILKSHYNEWSRSRKYLTTVLPCVTAASPFTFTPSVDHNNNDTKLPPKEETPLSKRITHNFIADAVEKASDKVVYIDIKDARRFVCQASHLCVSFIVHFACCFDLNTVEGGMTQSTV